MPCSVTVVIPVFNDPAGIELVLGALVRQTYPQDVTQIIVADNGSTDNTLNVVRRLQAQYPALIHVVVEDGIRSSYAARNKGIQASSGGVLAFTDADCKPAPTWLEEGIQALEQEQAAGAAGHIQMTFQGEKPSVWEFFDAAGKLDQRSYVENVGFGATANLFVRREVLARHGVFRSDLQSGGDYEFGRRVTGAGEKLVYAERAIVYHAARTSFEAKLKKSRRVAKGQKQLAAMGLLEHANLSWRQLIPVRRCPPLDGVYLVRWQRLAVVLIFNFFSYYNFVLRL